MEPKALTWTEKHTQIVERVEKHLEQGQSQTRKVYPSYSEYMKALYGKTA